MGKITSIYLTDGEAKKLEKFCEENQCTQYSALKTALRELLLKPAEENEAPAVDGKQETAEDNAEAEKIEKAEKERVLSLKEILRRL